MPSAGYSGVLTIDGNTLTEARDVTASLSVDEIEVTNRGSSGFKEFIAGLMEMTIDFDMVWESTMSTAGQAIRTAFMAKGTVAFEMLDDDGEGFTGTAIVTKYDKGEPLADAQTVSVTLRPTAAITIANGTPTS